ncbi:MAG TPA: hypothetical protein VF053_18245 [Streptosporangiales bacterium]
MASADQTEATAYADGGEPLLGNRFGITDPRVLDAAARGVAEYRYAQLRSEPPPDRFDTDYLNGLHRRLYGDVYPGAGALRRSDVVVQAGGREVRVGTPGDSPGHECLPDYMAMMILQRERESALRPGGEKDGVRWANVAGYHVAEAFVAAPYPAGNELTMRLFTEQLAKAAGHPLDFRRAQDALGEHAFEKAVDAARRLDYEPMREFLGRAASPRVVTREVMPRNHLDFIDHMQRAELTAVAYPVKPARYSREWLEALREMNQAVVRSQANRPLAYENAARDWQRAPHRETRRGTDNDRSARQRRDDRRHPEPAPHAPTR